MFTNIAIPLKQAVKSYNDAQGGDVSSDHCSPAIGVEYL